MWNWLKNRIWSKKKTESKRVISSEDEMKRTYRVNSEAEVRAIVCSLTMETGRALIGNVDWRPNGTGILEVSFSKK